MKELNNSKTLIIGIGNSGRKDDGLGWAFVDKVEKSKAFKGEIDYCYQLNVENSEQLTNYENVVFVDACQSDLDKGFALEECMPAAVFEFTTHALQPASVVYLGEELYNWTGNAYLLKIRGEDWKLEYGLSDEAASNMDSAFKYFERFLSN